jgi:tripartite-type tricarboxylate transporter receptor subunit TctC
MIKFSPGVLFRALLLLGIAVGGAHAQSYPQRPVRVIAPQAGTSIDFLLRVIAGPVGEGLGQPLVIENRALVGAASVATAAPDGYTLVAYTNPLWLMPLFHDTVWDPLRDFVPISLLSSTPSMLVVNPSLPVKTVKELIAYARARPNELNYASGSTGSATHIGAELFKAMAGIDIVRINYKGTAAAVVDLLAGRVQLMFPSAGAITAHVKDGRLRALAVASPESSALAPDLPTLSVAGGLPGFESRTLTGLLAPVKTPQPIVARLNEQFVRVLNRPEIKEKLLASGIEAIGSTPHQLAQTIASEVAVIGKLIKEKGLKN